MRFRISIITFFMTVLAFAPFYVFAEGGEVSLKPQHGIPLVIVYVNETEEDIEAKELEDQEHDYGTIDEMNGSENHSVRALGEVEIVVPQEYIGPYGSNEVPSGRARLGYIRGRGNSTWTEDKKPYKLHFENKQDYFGMGKAKNWALMANVNDDTLVRNRITSWLGDKLGMPFTPQMIPVDLVMIGVRKVGDEEQEVSRKYLGSYCLSELVEIGKNRVDIDELGEDDGTNVNEPAIVTGGYLLGIYCVSQDEDKVPETSHFTTPSGVKITNNDPEFTEDLSEGRQKQRDYIRDYIDRLDRLIMESEEITLDLHKEIAGMLDLQSVADYWWIQEVSYNTDAFETGSTYMYKARNGKLCFGPLWDFDLAWSLNTDIDNGYAIGFNNTSMAWIDQLREKDPEFVKLLKQRWDADNGIKNALKQVTADSEEGLLNKYKQELAASRAADEECWPEVYEELDVRDFDQCIKKLRYWIDQRAAWMNDNLENAGRVYFTMTYETDDGQVFTKQSVRGDLHIGKGPEGPKKTGYIFTGWKDKETGIRHENCDVTGDMTFVPEYQKDSVDTIPTDLFMLNYEEWVAFTPEENGKCYYYIEDPAVIPETAIVGHISWSSSNENILYFGESDEAVIIGTGDVDLTARIRNGLSKTIHMHIYDPDQDGMKEVLPESMSLEPSSCTIKKGETIQITPKLLPEGKPLTRMFYSLEPDDDSIVKFHSMLSNVITGVKPGTVNITVTASDADDQKTLKAVFRVTVTDEAAPVKADKDSGSSVVSNGGATTGKQTKPSTKIKIRPKGTKILKLKRGRRFVTVKWKRQSGKVLSRHITGYQLQFATNRKFTKNRKTFKIKGYKRTSKKVFGLKKKRKYYVRIRTYLNRKGKRYVSKWSPVKKVKTK